MSDLLKARPRRAAGLAVLLGLSLVLGATTAAAGADRRPSAATAEAGAGEGKAAKVKAAKAKAKAKAAKAKAKKAAKAKAAKARAAAAQQSQSAASSSHSAASAQSPGTPAASQPGATGAQSPAEPAEDGASASASGPPNRIAGCTRLVDFDSSTFPGRPDIDNPYLPFVPGTQLVLQGRSNVTGQLVDHTVTFTVTDLAKTVNGVSSLVIYDVDQSEGTVTEAELAFFAQDDAGNVWNLGEYPEEFENGVFVGAPSTWIAGEQRAEAGIHMQAVPAVDGPRYLQGFVPRIRFMDCAQVVGAGQQVAVSGGTFDNVLVTDETSPLEPGSGSQQKYHAPGVGIVKVGFLDDPQAEELELVEVNLLTAAEMAQARAAALALDARGYVESDVYEATGPATRL